MTPELPYDEGDLFAVPLPGGGYAVGVVARMDRKGVLLAYFFGPRSERLPPLPHLGEVRALDAILVQRLGDVGLVDGDWPIIGHLPSWRREEWPMPAFGRHEELTDRYFRVEYADDDPNRSPDESQISANEFGRLPEDGLAGFRFVETVLSRRLAEGH